MKKNSAKSIFSVVYIKNIFDGVPCLSYVIKQFRIVNNNNFALIDRYSSLECGYIYFMVLFYGTETGFVSHMPSCTSI